MFEIKLLDIQPDDNNDEFENQDCQYGKIQIDSFVETIIVPTDFWTPENYKEQWKEAIERIFNNDESMLMTSIHAPESANFFEIWPMYKSNEDIIFQNSLLFLEQLSTPFDIKNIYNSIPPRYTKDNPQFYKKHFIESDSEDEELPSEWKIKSFHLVNFLKNL